MEELKSRDVNDESRGVTGFGLSCDVEDKTKVPFRVVLKKGRKKTLSCLFLSGSFFKGQISSSHAE